MANPYRAMCAELVELSAPVDSIPQLAERLQKLNALADRARALLAEPAPPSDGEVAELVKWLHRRAAEVQAENFTTIYSAHPLTRTADLLAQSEPEGSASMMDYARQCNTQAVAALVVLEALADAADQFGPTGGADGKALAAEVEKARGFLARLSLAHPAPVPVIELPQGWHMLCDIEPEPGAMCDWVIMAPWGCDHGSGQWRSVHVKGFADKRGLMVSDSKLTAWRALPLPTPEATND